MEKLDNWGIEGGTSLTKDFTCETFAAAIAFVSKVAQIAEEQQHHPSILIEGTLVRLTLTTHSEHGLTEKDFMLAQSIDALDKKGEVKTP